MNNFEIYIINKKNINKISKLFSKIFISGSIISLTGNIGLGKTFFVKNLIGFLIKYKNIIKSPTFSLSENYFIFDILIYHSDLYKLLKNKSFIKKEILNYKKKLYSNNRMG